MTALVVGSLSPDFGYYTRSFGIATAAHSLGGSIFICLPSAVLMMGLILLFQKPLLFLMPSRLSGFLQTALRFPPQSKWRLAVQMCFWTWIGACTHILWDAFTHRTGWFVERSSLLQESLVSIGGSPLPTYYILQQISTILGLAVLVVFLFRVLSRSPADPWQRKADLMRYTYWITMVIVSILAVLPFAWNFASQFAGFLRLRSFIFQIGILSGSVFASLLVASLIISAAILRKR